VIVDEAALVDDFQLRDCYRIIGAHDGAMIWSGTPTQYESLFVKNYEETEEAQKRGEKTTWEIWSWGAADCPGLRNLMEEAKRELPEDVWQIFWEGKPYPLTGTMIPRDAMVKAVRGITRFKYNEEFLTVAGIDWGWCISGDTEVLTDSGWKLIGELEENDLVYTINPKTKEGEYQTYEKSCHERFSGTLTNIKSRNIDILTTWDHCLLTYDRNFENPHLHNVGDRVTHHIIPRFAPHKGHKPEFYTIPSIESPRTDLDFTEKKIPIESFLKLLGWYLSKGWCYSKGIVISQKDERGIKVLKKDLNELGYNYLQDNDEWKISSVQLKAYFKQFGKSKDRFIPQDIKNLDGSLLRILISRLMEGDGDRDGYRYNTYSKQLAEDFAEIYCKSGLGYAIVKDRREKGYRVNLLHRHSSPNKAHYKEVEWSGSLWSIKTPNKTLYIRRNGKPTFIHNGDPTVLTIWQLNNEGIYECLLAKAWSNTDFDYIHKQIDRYADQYNVFRIYADVSHKGENLRMIKRGLPVTEVPFNANKATMQSNLRDLFIKGRVRIPDEPEFSDMVYQLRSYTWDKKSGEDYVDSAMLSLKDSIRERSNPIYIAHGKTRRKRKFTLPK